MLGGTARRMLAGEQLEPLSAPKETTSLVQPLTFARIHQYISMAVPMLWLRQRDAIGAIGLAVNASRERNGHHEEAERIQELLVTAQELWREGARSTPTTSASRRCARRSSSSTSPTWSRSRRARSASHDREQPARALDALELVLAAILEVDSRARDDIRVVA